MFSDRYHLTASALAQVCPSMTGLMLWLTSFKRCRTSLLLLVLNPFLKVRAAFFKVDSTISGAFQCSTYSAGAPPTCTSSIIIFLGVEGPFMDEVSSSRVVCRNCYLAGCVGAFLQLFKVLLQVISTVDGFNAFFLFNRRFTVVCCFSVASLEKNLAHLLHLWLVLSIKHSIVCSICRISSSVAVNMASS